MRLILLDRGTSEIRRDGTGWFRFIAVEGHMDCRYVERKGRPAVEFSWDGNDEGDRVTGRGLGQATRR